jgi:hypothetical protein
MGFLICIVHYDMINVSIMLSMSSPLHFRCCRNAQEWNCVVLLDSYSIGWTTLRAKQLLLVNKLQVQCIKVLLLYFN